MSEALVVRDVGCRLRSGRVILREVSATFEAGSVTALVGENGSGKSTLARILAGVDRSDSGAVQRPPGRTHLVPERAPALAGCSTQTLARAFAPRGAIRTSVDTRLTASLAQLGFSHDATTPLSRLSKGNLQKAHLAVAYAVTPSAAIIDEPATGLDVRARTAATRLLRGLADEGSVVIITAHTTVADVDQSLQLLAGRLVAMDAPGDGRWFVVRWRGVDLRPRAVIGSLVEPDHDGWRARVAQRDLERFLVTAVDAGAEVVGVTAATLGDEQ